MDSFPGRCCGTQPASNSTDQICMLYHTRVSFTFGERRLDSRPISLYNSFSLCSSMSSSTDLALGQNLAHILPPSWREDVHRWYAEDTPSFDWAGFVVGEEEQEAILWGKSGVGLRVSPYRWLLRALL